MNSSCLANYRAAHSMFVSVRVRMQLNGGVIAKVINACDLWPLPLYSASKHKSMRRVIPLILHFHPVLLATRVDRLLHGMVEKYGRELQCYLGDFAFKLCWGASGARLGVELRKQCVEFGGWMGMVEV